MLSFIGKFLPNLLPAAAAFLNPWVLVAVLVYGTSMMFYGIHLESGRFDAFKATVAAAGEAQTARAVQKAKDNKALKKETDDAYKTDHDKLAADNAALTKRVHDGAGPRFVSARQQPDGSKCPDGLLCFAAAEFDDAIRVGLDGAQSFAEAAARITGQGTEINLKLETARKWTTEQRKR